MNALVEKRIKKLIARYLDTTVRRVRDLIYINVLPNSKGTFEYINQTFLDGGFDALRSINIEDFEDDPDILLIFQCKTDDGRDFLAIILDPLELYDPMSILKLSPL